MLMTLLTSHKSCAMFLEKLSLNGTKHQEYFSYILSVKRRNKEMYRSIGIHVMLEIM